MLSVISLSCFIETQAALVSAAGFIRRLIAERIQLRFAPEINFEIDKSNQHSIRIQQIIDEVKEEDESKKNKQVSKKK